VEVGDLRVTADVALTHERRTVDAAEDHRVVADAHRVRGVARLDVERPRGLRDLLQHEVGVEDHALVLDLLPGLAEQLQRALGKELHADLAHDPPPPAVEGGHRFLGKDLVARHGVAEHADPLRISP
jgi:hypothetical protein